MTTITFDTLKINNRLRSEGFTEQQAAALTETVKEVANAITSDLGGYPTRADLNLSVAELRSDMTELKSDLIKWMFGGFLTVISILVAILFKLH